MISIFNGTRRTLGKPSEKDIYAQIGVDFRKYLKYFKGAKLSVFMAISLHANEEGIAFPSYDLLMEETGLGRDTIAQALNDLCELTIEGNRILTKWRTRNSKGQLIGSNNYKIFPTTEDCQSWENPTLEKSLLEEEPSVKEEPKRKEYIAKSEKPKAERPQDLLFNAIRDTLGIINGDRIGMIKACMLGTSVKHKSCNFDTPATAEEVIAFGKWYTNKYPRASLPHDPVKIQNHFHAFRKGNKPKTRTDENGMSKIYIDGLGWTDLFGAHNAQYD